VLYYKV